MSDFFDFHFMAHPNMFFRALHEGVLQSDGKKQYKYEKSEYHNQICPTILQTLSFYMGKTWYILKILGSFHIHLLISLTNSQ